MRLAVLLCACTGTRAPAIENRGGTPPVRCEVPARFDFEARRYANLDADQPGYQTWSAWRVGIVLDRELRGSLAMVGDELTWTFDIAGKLDGCQLALATTNTHEPFTVALDLAARTGRIASIDDVWLLGPPFPRQR